MLIKTGRWETQNKKKLMSIPQCLQFFLFFFSIHVLREETVIPPHLSAPLQIKCIYVQHQYIGWFPGYSFAKYSEGSWMWKLLCEAKYYSAFKWLIKMLLLKSICMYTQLGCVYTDPLDRDIFMRHFKKWTEFKFV